MRRALTSWRSATDPPSASLGARRQRQGEERPFTSLSQEAINVQPGLDTACAVLLGPVLKRFRSEVQAGR